MPGGKIRGLSEKVLREDGEDLLWDLATGSLSKAKKPSGKNGSDNGLRATDQGKEKPGFVEEAEWTGRVRELHLSRQRGGRRVARVFK